MLLPTPSAFVSSADASTRAQTASAARRVEVDMMATPTIAKCGCDERAIATHQGGGCSAMVPTHARTLGPFPVRDLLR